MAGSNAVDCGDVESSDLSKVAEVSGDAGEESAGG